MSEPSREEMIEALRSAEALAQHHVRSWNEYPDSEAGRAAAKQLAGIQAALRELEAGGWRTPGEKIIAGLRDAALVTRIASEALRNFPEGTVTADRLNEVIVAFAPYVSSPPTTSDGGEG